jgi:hypothetical protein
MENNRIMTNWKKALIFGSIGAGAVLFFTGRRPAGLATATVGLAVLAAEYPETFEGVWENAPEYVTRGVQIFQTLSQIAERFAEQAAGRGSVAYREITEEYGA